MTPLGMVQVPSSWRVQKGPPGWARKISSFPAVRRKRSIPALIFLDLAMESASASLLGEIQRPQRGAASLLQGRALDGGEDLLRPPLVHREAQRSRQLGEIDDLQPPALDLGRDLLVLHGNCEPPDERCFARHVPDPRQSRTLSPQAASRPFPDSAGQNGRGAAL